MSVSRDVESMNTVSFTYLQIPSGGGGSERRTNESFSSHEVVRNTSPTLKPRLKIGPGATLRLKFSVTNRLGLWNAVGLPLEFHSVGLIPYLGSTFALPRPF